MPTATATPTKPTATPRPSLSSLALRFDDVDQVLSGYYQPNFSEPLPEINIEGNLEEYARAFRTDIGVGRLTVNLFRMENDFTAQAVVNILRGEYAGTRLVIDVEGLPSITWAVETADRQVVLASSTGEVVMVLFYDLFSDTSGDQASIFVGLMAKAQIRRLQQGGYQ